MEEERAFTSRELEQGIEGFAVFSRKSLNQFCGNKEFKKPYSYAGTVALYTDGGQGSRMGGMYGSF